MAGSSAFRGVHIVTAASQELADQLAAVLAFDGAIGARSEVVDGVYTGRPDGPFTYGEGKAQAIRALAAERAIDLSASYAYSDSASDEPMLRAVGHPVAVDPDRSLARIAWSRGGRRCASSCCTADCGWSPAPAPCSRWVAAWAR